MLKSVKSSNKSTLLASSRPSVQRARLVRPASAETDAASVTYTSSSNGASSNGASASTAAAATSTVAAPAPQPSTPSSSSSSSSSSSVVTSIKLQLLELVAALDRGRLAGHADKEAVERLVASLEGSGAGLQPFGGTPAPVEGRWELLYTNKEVFRASPFFAAFQGGLVQSKELAEAIFAFTDAIPGADILSAHQTVSLLSGSLISEVGMRVWPGFSGTVVTSSRLSVASPTRLDLAVEKTRVAGSSFGPFLDNVAVPVEQLITQLRGEGAAAASYEVTFVDAQLRVTRAGDQLLLHRRVV
uniref:Plastid lipid-associated protein/fibrillin conserved domain-containing protein n=1 Tax=Tetradesmus obliquus TaxID=3088 RepID=A0A383WFJ5_TETOB|eukprot:jgi/Sobl393_1/1836/SZX76191.1